MNKINKTKNRNIKQKWEQNNNKMSKSHMSVLRAWYFILKFLKSQF